MTKKISTISFHVSYVDKKYQENTVKDIGKQGVIVHKPKYQDEMPPIQTRIQDHK